MNRIISIALFFFVTGFISVNAQWGNFAPPTAPSALNATLRLPDGILLSWQDNSDNELGFWIKRVNVVTNREKTLTAFNSMTSFIDTKELEDGQSYCYSIVAYNSFGVSAFSNSICITATLITAPEVPTNFLATEINARTVQIEWQDNTDKEDYYVLEQSVNHGVWHKSTLEITDPEVRILKEDLLPRQTYCYRLRAENSFFVSETVGPICVNTDGVDPLTPIVSTFELSTPTTIELGWTLQDEPTSAFQYRIQVQTNAAWYDVANDYTQTTLTNLDLPEMQSHCYRLQSFDNTRTSLWSEPICQSTSIIPPKSVSLQNFSPKQEEQHQTLEASWTSSEPQNYLSYEFELTEEDKQPKILGTADSEITLPNLHDFTKYKLRIRAKRAKDNFVAYSDWTDIAETSTWLAFWPGETNGDYRVNIEDLVQLTQDQIYNQKTSFTTSANEYAWEVIPIDPNGENITLLRADTNRDGVIDIFDIFAIIANYEKETPLAAPNADGAGKIGSQKQLQLLSSIANNLEEGSVIKRDLSSLLKDYYEQLPESITLYPNHPNPFNAQTTITFDLPESMDVKLAIYNVLGQEVQLLVDDSLPAGKHEYLFEGSSLPSGMYLYRLETNQALQIKQMILKK